MYKMAFSEMSFFIHLLLLLCPVYMREDLRVLRYKQYTPDNTNWKTWTMAQTICRKRHIDLVFITNETENHFITKRYGWIGLYRDDQNSVWKWSRTNETATFTIWTVKPNDNDHCAYKYAGYHGWIAGNCNSLHPFICYRETLVLVKENKTWEDALEHCRSLKVTDPTDYNSHHFDLATLLSPDDLDYAREKMQESTTDMVWTGLRFLAGRWLWVSGDQLQHTIKPCEDNKACGGLNKHYSDPYKRSDCGRKFNFLCSWKH